MGELVERLAERRRRPSHVTTELEEFGFPSCCWTSDALPNHPEHPSGHAFSSPRAKSFFWTSYVEWALYFQAGKICRAFGITAIRSTARSSKKKTNPERRTSSSRRHCQPGVDLRKIGTLSARVAISQVY